MSKFSLDVLQKYVFPNTKTEDPDVILGAVFGEDELARMWALYPRERES